MLIFLNKQKYTNMAKKIEGKKIMNFYRLEKNKVVIIINYTIKYKYIYMNGKNIQKYWIEHITEHNKSIKVTVDKTRGES